MRSIIFFIISVLILSGGITAALSLSVSIATDKAVYNPGEAVNVSGRVPQSGG